MRTAVQALLRDQACFTVVPPGRDARDSSGFYGGRSHSSGGRGGGRGGGGHGYRDDSGFGAQSQRSAAQPFQQGAGVTPRAPVQHGHGHGHGLAHGHHPHTHHGGGGNGTIGSGSGGAAGDRWRNADEKARGGPPERPSLSPEQQAERSILANLNKLTKSNLTKIAANLSTCINAENAADGCRLILKASYSDRNRADLYCRVIKALMDAGRGAAAVSVRDVADAALRESLESCSGLASDLGDLGDESPDANYIGFCDIKLARSAAAGRAETLAEMYSRTMKDDALLDALCTAHLRALVDALSMHAYVVEATLECLRPILARCGGMRGRLEEVVRSKGGCAALPSMRSRFMLDDMLNGKR